MLGALAFTAVRISGLGANSSGTQTDQATDVAVDSAGNVLVTGFTTPSATLPGFVAKFTPDLSTTPVWQRKQSLTNSFSTRAVGVDSSDNVYIACKGFVTAAPDLPHLIKYDSAGAIQWQRRCSAAESMDVSGLVVTAAGDCYLALNNGAAENPYGNVVKYNSFGTIQWQRKISSTYDTSISGIAATHDGGVVVCGMFRDGADALANARGYVAKYNNSGTIQWQFKIHFSAQGFFNAIAVDSATGDIYVGGYRNTGTQNGVLFKLNSSGTVQWHKLHPTVNSGVTRVTVDAVTGNIFVYQQNATSITCFDPGGTVLWTRVFAAQTLIFGNQMLVKGSFLYATFQAQKTGNGYDVTFLQIPKDTGGAAGTYGHVTTTDPGVVTYTTESPTSAAAGLTDAAGALTDAAGAVTDAAHNLTFYAIP